MPRKCRYAPVVRVTMPRQLSFEDASEGQQSHPSDDALGDSFDHNQDDVDCKPAKNKSWKESPHDVAALGSVQPSQLSHRNLAWKP